MVIQKFFLTFLVVLTSTLVLQSCISTQEAEDELNNRSGFEDCILTKLYVNGDCLYVARCSYSATSTSNFRSKIVTFD